MEERKEEKGKIETFKDICIGISMIAQSVSKTLDSVERLVRTLKENDTNSEEQKEREEQEE